MAGKDRKQTFVEYMSMTTEEGEAKSDVKELTGGIDFSVDVLTTGYWPTYKMLEINLPPPASPPPPLHPNANP